MDSAGRTFEWHEVRPEKVPESLATHQPVCWNCHIAETFRRQFPQLIVERPEREFVKPGADSSELSPVHGEKPSISRCDRCPSLVEKGDRAALARAGD